MLYLYKILGIGVMKVKVLVTQSCPSLHSSMDCSFPGSSVHEIIQARILEWLPFPSPGDLPDPGIEPGSPAFVIRSISKCCLTFSHHEENIIFCHLTKDHLYLPLSILKATNLHKHEIATGILLSPYILFFN